VRSTNDFSEVLLPKEFSGKGKTAASPQTKKKKISDQEDLKKAKRQSVLGMADDLSICKSVCGQTPYRNDRPVAGRSWKNMSSNKLHISRNQQNNYETSKGG
jgi:hypothetical protein